MAEIVSGMAAGLLDRAVPRLRRFGLINLSFALPELTVADHQRIVDGVFANIARLLLTLTRSRRFNSGNVRQWIDYIGLENYQRAKAKGKGVLIATAHFGNWEFSAFSHALMTESMGVMVRPLDNPIIDDFVERMRTLSGNRLIHKKDGARSVLKALRANEAVGILIDQNTSLSEGVFVNFFGRPACANSGFVKLAHHSSAPVIPGYALWNKTTRRYDLHFHEEIPMTGDVATDTQNLHSFWEAVIRKNPDQWMWIHRRWKTRPPGDAPIY